MSVSFTEEGEILYISDYNAKKEYGTLYRYNGGDPEMIDEEVQEIVYAITAEQYYNIYN